MLVNAASVAALVRKSVMVSVVVALIGVSSASAQPVTLKLVYDVDLTQGHLTVTYQGGIDVVRLWHWTGRTGLLADAFVSDSAWTLAMRPTGGGFSGDLEQTVDVTGAHVLGAAQVPDNSTVTVSNDETGTKIKLPAGERVPFSIPTGVQASPGPPQGGLPEVVSCRGTAEECQARVNIAKGPAERTLKVDLPGKHLWLASTTAIPRSARTDYDFTNAHFAAGRSEYVAHLDAVRPDPHGSYLKLGFRVLPPVIH
jgi:hypothetical protein